MNTAAQLAPVSPRAKLSTAAAIKQFVTAGHARFTLVSGATGTRFTFEVVQPEEQRNPAAPVMFVRVLTGQNNESDYTFLGTIFTTTRAQIGGGHFGPVYGNVPCAPKFIHSSKSRIAATAPSARAFAWAWPRIVAGVELLNCEVWHEGRCGRCGRALTVPESIESGIGPVCAEKGL